MFFNSRKLNLTDNPHLYVKALISVVLNCAHLEDLRISKFSNKRDSFQNEDAILILSNLSETLKSLSLDCTLLSSTTIQVSTTMIFSMFIIHFSYIYMYLLNLTNVYVFS